MKPLPVLFAQEGVSSAPNVPVDGRQAQPQQPASSFVPLMMIAAMAGLFFFVILPQKRRQQREQEQVMSTLKRGAKVALHSGIVGTIINVKDGEDELTIRSEESKLRVLRSAIARVISQDDSVANTDVKTS